MDEYPPLVFPLTREEAGPGRPSACLPGVGRFPAVLAAGCAGGQICELGTGAGIGTGWIASAMPADCSLITAEMQAEGSQFPPPPVSPASLPSVPSLARPDGLRRASHLAVSIRLGRTLGGCVNTYRMCDYLLGGRFL
jgi:hypothetical protein